MFKSIIKCTILSSVNLRNCEYKCIHFVNSPRTPSSSCTNQISCKSRSNRTSFGKYKFCVSSRQFFTDGLKNSQPDTKLDTTSNNLSKQNNSSTDDDKEKLDSNIPELFDCINFEEITGGDEETLNKFNLLLLEVDVLRQDGLKVPKSLTTDQWKELFELKSRNQRSKFLKFLWTKEILKLSDKRKKEERRAKLYEKQALLDIENQNNDHIKYGFHGSTIFLRIYNSTMDLYYNYKLAQAMLFGQNIVIDCGYDTDMSSMENKLCVKQLGILFADNRMDKEPFNLHFCNMNRDGILFKHFKRSIPPLDEPHFPINIREESYLDLFPREKLVYLTPHCRTELKHFDHEDIYIIGALVDRQITDHLSLAKAKSEGIRMAHLPLDRYLEWGLGTKSLTINQVLNILLDVRTTGDWNSAFKHVPKRKVRVPGEPVRDPRKLFRRGTTLQPGSQYISKFERRNNSRFY